MAVPTDNRKQKQIKNIILKNKVNKGDVRVHSSLSSQKTIIIFIILTQLMQKVDSWIRFNKLFRDAKTQLNMCCAAGNSNNARAFFWDLIDGQIMFRKESKTLCKTTIYLRKSKEMIKPRIINIKMGGKKWIFLGGLKQFIVCILLYWTHNYLITQIFATMEKVLRFPNTMITGISYGFIVSDKRWLNFWVI